MHIHVMQQQHLTFSHILNQVPYPPTSRQQAIQNGGCKWVWLCQTNYDIALPISLILHFVLCIKAFQQQREERARKAEVENEKLQKEIAMMQKLEQKYKVHE